MKKKEDYLNVDNAIKIKSYNYEESNGFSQETAVEQHIGKYKEHKFLINIDGKDYSLNFLYSHVIEKYAAMEDEWVEQEKLLRDDEKLIIYKIEEDFPYESERYSIENLNENIIEFKKQLIKSAKEIGIGCNYSKHMNGEDDFGRTSYDIKNSKTYLLSDEVLFIDEDEIDFFEEYLSLENDGEKKEFFNNLKNIMEIRIQEKKEQKEQEREIRKQEQKEQERKIFEEKADLVNPLLQECMELETTMHDFECDMESQQKYSEYTVKEIQKEIQKENDNLEKAEKEGDIDYYYEKFFMLEKLYELKELKKRTVAINEIKNKILKHISEEELEYSLKNSFEYIDYDPEEYWFKRYEEAEIDTPCFQYEEEFLEYEYNKQRTIEERFEAIKIYIRNELTTDIIPDELKERFNMKDEVKQFLNNKSNRNQSEIKLQRKKERKY